METAKTGTYLEAERKFLQEQAEQLHSSQQLCEMHTRTVGSIYRGVVISTDEGGIVFQKEDLSTVAIPISLVEKLITLPSSWGAPVGNEASLKTRSAGR